MITSPVFTYLALTLLHGEPERFYNPFLLVLQIFHYCQRTAESMFQRDMA